MFSDRIEVDSTAAERFRRRLPALMVAFVNLVSRTFGCWHSEMSRPFTINHETYRVCLDCGARRQFLPDHWQTTGYFYRQANPADSLSSPSIDQSNQNHEESINPFSATSVVR